MPPIVTRSRLQVGDYGYGDGDGGDGDGGGSAVDLLSLDVCRWLSGMA